MLIKLNRWQYSGACRFCGGKILVLFVYYMQHGNHCVFWDGYGTSGRGIFRLCQLYLLCNGLILILIPYPTTRFFYLLISGYMSIYVAAHKYTVLRTFYDKIDWIIFILHILIAYFWIDSSNFSSNCNTNIYIHPLMC